MIRFGGPIVVDFDAMGRDPEAYVRAHVAKGYRAANAPAGLAPSDTDTIRALRKAFAENDIVIAEVGVFNNMLDPDPAARNASREQVLGGLQVAELLGARCFVGILGTFGSGRCRDAHIARNFSQDAFDAAVELARYFIDEVKPKETCFAFESFPFNVIDCPETMAELVKAVDRKSYAVHMDLVNLVNTPRKYFASGELAWQCVRMCGDRIISAHAKDILALVPSISVMFEEVVPGRGNIDYSEYLRALNSLPGEIPLLMEHLDTEEEFDEGAQHIRKVASAEGIPL